MIVSRPHRLRAGGTHLQARVRLPPAAVLPRQHRRDPGRPAATGQRRRQHRRRSHHRAGRRARPDPRRPPPRPRQPHPCRQRRIRQSLPGPYPRSALTRDPHHILRILRQVLRHRASPARDPPAPGLPLAHRPRTGRGPARRRPGRRADRPGRPARPFRRHPDHRPARTPSPRCPAVPVGLDAGMRHQAFLVEERASAAARPPDSAAFPPTGSRSTQPGWSWALLGPACSPGPASCCWTANWPPPNRRNCPTGCYISSPASPTADNAEPADPRGLALGKRTRQGLRPTRHAAPPGELTLLPLPAHNREGPGEPGHRVSTRRARR